jgi:4-coumarate--CoA ligase
VSPAEIEAVLQEHPAVQAVGVVGVPNAATTCLARAFVVKKAGCDVSAEELCDFVKGRLPDYKQLHGGVEFLSSLPESRGNKLDRVALQKMAVKG